MSLNRFLEAQASTYHQALTEISNGHKQSHWMWYIFPQIAGLGHSSTAQYYAIANAHEAEAYAQHPVLGSRLDACVQAALNSGVSNPISLFGHTDALKFKSCLTLFATVVPQNKVFAQALHYFYDGATDQRTLKLLNAL